MIIVLKQHAPADKVEAFCKELNGMGYQINDSVGSDTHILGLIGDTKALAESWVLANPDESFIRCHGWLGHLGDCEWRTEADHRLHRERNHDGAVFSSSGVDVRREDRKRLEEDTVAKR